MQHKMWDIFKHGTGTSRGCVDFEGGAGGSLLTMQQEAN